MNVQDIKRIARNARTTIQNKVSSATGKKLMIVAGGVALLAGGAGTAIAMQSHAQSRITTTASSLQQVRTPAVGSKVVGTVTAISGSTITVSDKQDNTTYTVDASNATIVKNNPPATPVKPTETTITVSGIAVGDNLMIQGTVSGTNISATKIVDGKMFGGPGMPGRGTDTRPIVVGTVTAISGSTITVSNKQNSTSYTIDASAATVKKVTVSATTATTKTPVKPTVTTITVSGIAVGDTVMVQGIVSGTSVSATSVVDGNFPAPRSGGWHIGNHSKPASSSATTTTTTATN